MTKVSSRVCPFCGARGNLSEEHPFGKWARPYISMHRIKTRLIGSTPVGGNYHVHDYKVNRVRDGDPMRQQIRSACIPCNTGWMSRIQDATAKIALPFVTGDFPALSFEERRQLATWAIMVTMNIEYFQPSTAYVHPSQRHALRKTEHPPENWYVGIGRYSGERLKSCFAHRAFAHASPLQPPERIPDDKKLQSTVFALGKVLFHTLSAGSSEAFHRAVSANPGDYGDTLGLRTLWPVCPWNQLAALNPFDDTRAELILMFHTGRPVSIWR